MKFDFKRENRGASSDVYSIVESHGNNIKGRLDLHFFSNGVIEGLVVFTEKISEKDELMMIEKIDKDLVPQAIIDDENFSITYRDPVQGKEVIASGITDGITNEQFETRLQNERRLIYVLRPAFLGIVLDDVERIMTYSPSSQYVNEKLKKGDNIKIK